MKIIATSKPQSHFQLEVYVNTKLTMLILISSLDGLHISSSGMICCFLPREALNLHTSASQHLPATIVHTPTVSTIQSITPPTEEEAASWALGANSGPQPVTWLGVVNNVDHGLLLLLGRCVPPMWRLQHVQARIESIGSSGRQAAFRSDWTKWEIENSNSLPQLFAGENTFWDGWFEEVKCSWLW